MSAKTVIDFDKVWQCNSGPYKIKKDLGIMPGPEGGQERHYVEIEFLNTGNISKVVLNKAMHGIVRDPQGNYNPNKIFQSNRCGPMKMIKWLGMVNRHARCLVQFLNTGSIVEAQVENVTGGNVSDPAAQEYYNLNYDPSRFNNYDEHINLLLCYIYNNMIGRCTKENHPSYGRYGAKGITVCERWLNSQEQFMIDVKTLDGFDKYYQRPYLYQFDKDYKQIDIPKNQRVYSPETCMFLYYNDNYNLSMIEKYKANPNLRYYGVFKNKNEAYNVRKTFSAMNKNRIPYNLGTYSSEIAAANVFNWWELHFHNYELVPLLNKLKPDEIMGPEEFIKYNVNPKQMCQIIGPCITPQQYIAQKIIQQREASAAAWGPASMIDILREMKITYNDIM